MGKRPAEVELFVGNMGSIQLEDSAFYAKRSIVDHGNRTRTNSRVRQAANQLLTSVSAGNLHATIRGSRGTGNLPGRPVAASRRCPYPDRADPQLPGPTLSG